MTREGSPGWSTFLGLGVAFAVIFAAGLILGWWLDGLLHTSPILVLVGMVIGLSGGFAYAYVKIRENL